MAVIIVKNDSVRSFSLPITNKSNTFPIRYKLFQFERFRLSFQDSCTKPFVLRKFLLNILIIVNKSRNGIL